MEISSVLVPTFVALAEDPNDRSSHVLHYAMATAINRVLNLLSHCAERKFGVTKYHEMAAKFRLPDWLVDLRHETTHGTMPSWAQMLEGAKLCVVWTLENYWKPETERLRASPKSGVKIRETAEYERIHKLLDCYGYLKLYNVWGTATVGELKDEQRELYDHISSLWDHFQVRLSSEESLILDENQKCYQKSIIMIILL